MDVIDLHREARKRLDEIRRRDWTPEEQPRLVRRVALLARLVQRCAQARADELYPFL